MRRTTEIEEATNRWIVHPLSARLVPICARLGIHPNVVSLSGMICGVTAGFAYAQYPRLPFIICGFLLMGAWHILDGVDGQLARLTSKQSALGKLLDGICDYITFIAVYVGIGYVLAPLYGGWIWGLIALAGIAHAVQAASYEAQRQDYDAWGKGLLHKRFTMSSSEAGWLYAAYLRLQLMVAGDIVALDRVMADAISCDPAQASLLQSRYQEIFAAPVRRWGVMSANWRTISLFIFCLIGLPAGYFLMEIIGFSMVCAMMLRAQRRRRAAFVEMIRSSSLSA
ncbi:CDP-alcohol phosphatidyltransferase family protein [Granulibacter bethesdensis]|uniref:Phosphatidylglycerophosphate synthase n=1 Tax=Granulibacter bethesdensis (strain ATCC BAA-1260 / CGDNIH1) TaxID=391165 RepID=Q0BVL6_GRABC|nr:CDP-alcohol phosphatidyltransferase family protein [Granulibacter bethesdensis]ABI61136.1 Phosphatidylglycerophosphate synthase [Granulibacter bethesdensis CGDNIH1]AHJ67234.1 Phosphatidylglycerophosphate synthase [Granulibacter bethesdensis]APH50911.1 Phosphatidylglycerophosphate synthase [Granulibacter bethesdensis]APH63606.1 Phosphatidylglycerophosphate synthase [Granulibacter bethesdensis]